MIIKLKISLDNKWKYNYVINISEKYHKINIKPNTQKKLFNVYYQINIKNSLHSFILLQWNDTNCDETMNNSDVFSPKKIKQENDGKIYSIIMMYRSFA